MAKSSRGFRNKQSISDGELIHIGAARLRVIGNGNLQTSFNGLSGLNVNNLVPIVLSAATNRELLVLANFKDTRGQFKLTVLNTDEWFRVTRIHIFVKPAESGYPQ